MASFANLEGALAMAGERFFGSFPEPAEVRADRGLGNKLSGQAPEGDKKPWLSGQAHLSER